MPQKRFPSPARRRIRRSAFSSTRAAASTATAIGIMISVVAVLETMKLMIAVAAMNANSIAAGVAAATLDDRECEPPVKARPLDREGKDRAAEDQEQDRRIIGTRRVRRGHDARARERQGTGAARWRSAAAPASSTRSPSGRRWRDVRQASTGIPAGAGSASMTRKAARPPHKPHRAVRSPVVQAGSPIMLICRP